MNWNRHDEGIYWIWTLRVPGFGVVATVEEWNIISGGMGMSRFPSREQKVSERLGYTVEVLNTLITFNGGVRGYAYTIEEAEKAVVAKLKDLSIAIQVLTKDK
jgi:hypothetical protein